MDLSKKLPACYRAAFQTVAAQLIADKQVRGATLSGSILRGEHGPTSDLDIFVVVKGKYRQRRQFVVEGALVEMFRNPVEQIEKYFKEEDHLAMHMLGYGEVIVDKDGALKKICARARKLYEAGPAALAPAKEVYSRYCVWDACCDVQDLLAAERVVEARGLMGKVIWDALAFHYARNRRWGFKPKRMLADLRAWQPKLAKHVETFFAAGDRAATAQFKKAISLIIAPQDLHKPMIWETPPDKVVD